MYIYRSLVLGVTLLWATPIAGRAADTLVPSPGASSRIDAIKQRGSLRVAVFNEYPWLKQTTGSADGPFEGPAWRLAEEYAKSLGVRLETVPVSQGDKIAILNSGKVDISIAPMLQTPARDEVVDFILYSVSAQCLFGLADNPKVAQAGSIDDLNRPDVTVAYTTGTPQGTWAQGRLSKAAFRGVPGSTADVQMAEILSHKSDVTTIDKFFFAAAAKKVPGLVSIPRGDACLASQELPIPIGMTIEKHQPEFLAWLRAVAEAVKPQITAEEVRVEKAGS